MIKYKVVFTEMTKDSKLQALATSVKKQKKSEKFINFSSTRQIIIKVSSSIRLTDPTIKD